MEVVAGLRVVRGPDWAWGEQDGGNGHLGTVVEVQRAHRPEIEPDQWSPNVVTVQWDCGNRCRYRCGIEEKYDLRVYDSAPAGLRHSNVVCDSCAMENISGLRWKCVKCYDFDLCSVCYMSGRHSLEHGFDYMDTNRKRTRIPARMGSKKTEVRGIFTHAEVVPGHDWSVQDGRQRVGQVASIQGDESNPNMRSIAEVRWSTGGEVTQHRVGLHGKVELKCTDPSSGGYYYPDHLPLLGAPAPPFNPEHISAGDLVRVELEPEVFKAMQEGHGGWNEPMLEIIGKTGTVMAFKDSGDLCVQYPHQVIWTICSEAVVKVDTPQFRLGDTVRVDEDMTKVKELQHGHYEWGANTVLMLGETGRVLQLMSTGDVMVAIKGRSWIFNPLCLSLAEEGGVTTSNSAVEAYKERSRESLEMLLLTLLQAQSPALVMAASVASDVSLLRTYLGEHPEQVDVITDGMTGLHCAANSGNVPVLKVLLEFGANVNRKTEGTGNTALHVCAASGHKECAQLLLDAGADVNRKNDTGYVPLSLAAMGGQSAMMRLLVNDPNIKLDEQDQDGNTALHNAVLAQKNSSITILLDAGADPTLLNFRLCTAIHDAAKTSFLPAMEQFMSKHPEHVNLECDYSYTALHYAALFNNPDIVTLLAETPGCKIDCRNEIEQTPLHIALIRGFSKIVERLVGYGASVNAQDIDGYGSLHILITKDTMEAPSSESPQLKKLQTMLFGEMSDNDAPLYSNITVAFFLIQNGADLHLVNKRGYSPLQMFPYIATLMTVYAENSELFEKGPSPGVAEGGLLRSYYSGGLPRMVRTTTPPSSGDGYYEQQGGYGGEEGSYGGTGGGGEGGYGGYGTMGEQGGYAGGGRYGRTQQAYGQYGTRQAFRSSRDGYAGTQQKTSGGGHSGVYPGTGSAGQGSDPDGYPTCQTAYVYGPSGGVGGGTYQASYGYGGTQGTYDGYRTGGRQSSSETKKTRSQSQSKPTPQFHAPPISQAPPTITPIEATGPPISRTPPSITPIDTPAPPISRAPPTITPIVIPAPCQAESRPAATSQAAPSPQDSMLSSITSTPPQDTDDQPEETGGGLCFLCDDIANVKFSPCGHSSMCSSCAPRAKRCPLCRAHVESFSELDVEGVLQ